MNSLRSLAQQIVPLTSSTKLLFSACTIPSRTQYNDSFLSGSNSTYIEDMYNAWLKNPANVHASWDSYFKNSQTSDSAYVRPPSLGHLGKNELFLSQVKAAAGGGGERAASSGSGGGDVAKSLDEHMKVQGIIRSYQSRGHLTAKLDPLELTLPSKERIGLTPREITEAYALSKDLMGKEFLLPPTTFIGGGKKSLPLSEIIKRLEEIYCTHIGVEYVKIDNHKQRQWIREKLEKPGVGKITTDEKRLLLARLTRSHGFEQFLAKKWPSEKRFGLEGCEVLIPAMKQIVDKSTLMGVESFIIGIPHRGRLNVLANICRKPLYQIFIQFAALESHEEGSGDVKYHLGTYIERLNRVTNKKVKIALMANPSHLETIGPVVQGRTRAEQFYNGDKDGTRSMSIQLHGDASFCGQGVVYETMHLSDLPAYTTHGTIHIVVNNQVGFTTDPKYSRSSPFCTDVGHVVTCPIFHVNADQPEAVMHVCNLAAEWRATFKRDVIIDLVCYRRNGHNEADEPMFTQPIMYTKIRKLKPILHLYSEKLIKEGIVKKEEVDDISKKYLEICNEAFAEAQKQTHLKFSEWIDSPWHGFFKGKDPLKCKPTGIKDDVIQQIGKVFASPPPGDFIIHRGIERILKARMKLVEAKQIDWALAEAMAWGSLLKEGIHVRLSGEDVERGTFSHRHHVLHHQTKDKVTYNPLEKMFPNQAPYTVCNSSLSEYGVLGFEFGYSLMNPNSLVMWEAQFGDFHNTGQCIIDTVISSGQSKWIRQSGLVLLLPHGMEGMGPEHSSARPERWLQMSTDDPDRKPPYGPEFAMRQLRDTNMIVANCSGPGNYFHLIRRQIALPFRKPCIVFTPKSLLKLPDARSPFDEIKEGTEFRRLIPDAGPASKKAGSVKKLIFCTGKVYYELAKAMKEKKLEEQIAISRVEQLVPFPYDLVKAETEKYPKAKIVWAQEEHKNHGYWEYVFHRIQNIVGKKRDVQYVGRASSAAPAAGYKFQHYKESKQLIADATAL